MVSPTAAFQNVSQTARTLKISRGTVQRNAPKGSKLRNERGLVDVEELRKRLFAPIGVKASYPAGMPRKQSGSKGSKAWAERRREQAKIRHSDFPELRLPGSKKITIEGIVWRFKGWFNFVNDRDPFNTWDVERLNKVKRLMSVFLEFAAEIEVRAGEMANPANHPDARQSQQRSASPVARTGSA